MSRLTESAARYALHDEERPFGSIPNAMAADWLEAHAPLLECPEPMLEDTFDFRCWTFRKHIRKDDVGYMFTEFLPDVPWAGPRNTINAAAGFHFREGRWFRGTEEMFRDYLRWWMRPEGRNHTLSGHTYTSWHAHALWDWCCVTGDFAFGVEMLDDIIDEYNDWEKRFQQPCGLYYSIDDRDAMEISISGHGLRPTRNSTMYGSAVAIAKFAALAGRDDVKAEFEAKAERIREAVEKYLWDKDFYRVVPEANMPDVENGTFHFSKVNPDNYVREEIGFIPWFFDLPKPGTHTEAFRQLNTAEGFAAPCGITTAERRHPRFNFKWDHECLWNGPVWPFATTQTLVAAANMLQGPAQSDFTKEDYYRLLMQYTRTMYMDTDDGRHINWVDENTDPFTGRWLSRDILESWGFPEAYGGYERGRDYNHSMFVDLVLSGLLGLDPGGEKLTAKPLIPDDWGWFRVQHVPFRGGVYTVQFDRDGTKYGMGKGVKILKEE